MAASILRLPAVIQRTGLSRSTIYLKVSQGIFPQPISLGPRSVGWLDSSVDKWIEECCQLSAACRGGQRG